MTTTERVRERPAVLKVTEAASTQLKKLIETHNPDAAGIRLAVNEGGCNGLTYAMDFADEKGDADEVMELDGVKLLIDPMAVMYLVGTEMDFVEEKLGSNFVFRNPNESGRCGCGESFNV
jgi:iron-sulfur cluster assembly protein